MVTAVSADQVRKVAASVVDPEIPVLTIEELGILRDVRVDEHGHVDVDITPTYSGCPALDAIRQDVQARFQESGYTDVSVHTVLSPAWTTDWLSETARRKLLQHGIAPPRPRDSKLQLLQLAVACPNCGAVETSEVARFASTACQALRRCSACSEPFPHFKEH
jgi:ring-1,2-phenylacetyl-CoA epoxidase subunit PaaD